MENEARKVLLCPKCGNEIEIIEHQTIGHCTFCDSLIPLPFFLVSRDRVSAVQYKNMLNRINKAIEFSQTYQFHRAFNLYDKLIKNNFNLNVKDAFPYFGKFLNQYGVTYIMNDSLQLELVCMNVLKESIYENENYQRALYASDANAQSIIKKEASAIDNFQKEVRKELIKSVPLDVAILTSLKDSTNPCPLKIKEDLEKQGKTCNITIVDLEKIEKEKIIELTKVLSMAKHLVIFSSEASTLNEIMYRNTWMSYYQDEEIQKNPANRITIMVKDKSFVEGLPIEHLPTFIYEQVEDATSNVINGLNNSVEEEVHEAEYEPLWEMLNNDQFDEVRDYLNRKLRKSSINYEGWLLLFLSKHKIKSLDSLDKLFINPLESYYFQRTYMYASRQNKEMLYQHYLNCLKNIEELYVKDDEYEKQVLEYQSKIYKKETIRVFLRIFPVIVVTLISIWTLSIASIAQLILALLLYIGSFIIFGLSFVKNMMMGRVPNVIKENNSEEQYLMQLRKLLDAKQAAKYIPGKKTNRMHLLSIIACAIVLAFTTAFIVKEVVIKIQNPSVNYYYVFDKAYVTSGNRESTYIPDTISGKTVEGITKKAFKNNSIIKNLVIEDGVKYIESDAFENCRNLTNVEIPASIQRVIDSPFENCTNLENFKYKGNTFKPADFFGNDYTKKMPNLKYIKE